MNPVVVKAALHVGKGKGKKGFFIAGSILLFLLLLLIFTSIRMVSVFLGYGVTSNFDRFDAKSTSLYQEVREIYQEYEAERKSDLQQMAEKIKEENMDYEEHSYYDTETDTIKTTTEWFCKATIYQSFQPINSVYFFSYISCKKVDEFMSSYQEAYHPTKAQLYEFWDAISTLKVEKTPDSEEENPVYNVYNQVLGVEEIAKKFFDFVAEQEFFLESVYQIRQYLGTEDFSEDDFFIESPNRMTVPLYYQYASSWGKVSYGDATISQNGCAPTSIAMVLSYLKKSEIYPNDITAYTGNRYYVNGVGSSWDIFSACAQHWGVTCNYIGTSGQRILQELSQGHPVILSMGPGTFTKGGHLIVLTGVSEDGKIYVNDPNDNAKKNHYGQEFSLSLITMEAKGGWSFY